MFGRDMFADLKLFVKQKTQGITPVGKMQAPKKPWERNNQQEQHQQQQQQGSNTTTISTSDLEFPPIQDDGTGGTAV